MNKKFLSAILFGALMVTSTGTFVSCKDYDDDIEEINNKISGIESAIADLQKKIGDGAYVKSITPSTNGFTVTMSDGSSTSITVKDGENGKDGTEWTISEDGFWVCNGEKTTVKAVGQDGEKGEAGQQEVKKENGKWYLWNAETEAFEEVKVDAPAAANVPYYYTDPADPNYTVLVIYDKDGKNEKAVRLPMAADLGQIVLLGEDLAINYHRFNGLRKKDGNNPPKEATWDGKRTMPAKGEYLLTANQNAVYVQVVPSNYDISKLNFKLVNTKGDEAPVVFGTPVPTTEAVSVPTRAVSESGVYAIPYTLKEMTKAELDAYNKNISGKALSLVANESVRSTYTYGVNLEPAGDTSASYEDVSVSVESLGTPVTVTPTAGCVYDSYLVMKDAAAKADSVRYGISIDGMTVSYNENIKKGAKIAFTVRQVTAKAIVDASQNVTITFGEAPVSTTEVLLAELSHNAVAIYTDNGKEVNKQFIVADFAPYFTQVAPTNGDRLIWNQDMKGITKEDVQIFWDELNEYGESIKEGGIDVTKALLSSVSYQTADGKDKVNDNPVTNADFGKLKLQFKKDYPGITLGNGTLKAVISMKTTGSAEVQKVEVPFTVAGPTKAEIAANYAWNTTYMKDGVLTIVDDDDNTITLEDYFDGTLNTENLKDNSSGKLEVDAAKGTVTLNGDNNTAYAVKGLRMEFLGEDTSYSEKEDGQSTKRIYGIDNLKVNFATSKKDDITIKSVDVMSGGKSVTIKDYRIAGANDLKYKLVDYAGDALDVTGTGLIYSSGNEDLIAAEGAVKLEKETIYYDKDGKVVDKEVEGGSEKTGYNLVITSSSTKVAADTVVPVEITFNNVNGRNKGVTVKINVTVKAAI